MLRSLSAAAVLAGATLLFTGGSAEAKTLTKQAVGGRLDPVDDTSDDRGRFKMLVKTRGAAVRQIRKLAEFMNLSYPIAADDGTLLEKFGDPRRVGAELPLWVVITPDGKVAHYKTGFYDIKPDEGLRQLQESIFEVIRNR